MRAKGRYLLFAVLAAVLLLAAFACAESPEAGLPDGYTLRAESEEWEMYLSEPTLSVLLRNKAAGTVLESTLSDGKDDGKNKKAWKGYLRSGVVLSVIRDANNTYQADLINNEHTIEYTYFENGFRADIYYTEYGIGFAVEARLEGNDFIATVPDDSIREETDGVYIATVSLFPMMGYTHLGDTAGYMLIPDGNGALISLTDKEGRFATGFSQMIYGPDSGFSESAANTLLWDRYETVVKPNRVTAPVFGMAHTEEGIGYLAVAEEGEDRCTVEAHPNGAMVDYNRCFAKFLTRDIYQQPLNQSSSGSVKTVEKDRTRHNMTVRYCLLSGDNANYTGMAVRYREYLLSTGRAEKRDTSWRTRVDFLGSDREKFLTGTRAVTMTTAEQARAILDELHARGAESTLTVYKGWQKGGVNALPTDSLNADGAIGGTKALKSLIADEGEKGHLILLYDDALRMNAATTAFTYDAVKMVNKRTLKEENTKQVYPLFYRLIPKKSAEKLENLVADMKKNGLGGIAVAGISDTLMSWSLKGGYYTRGDCARVYGEAVKNTAEETDYTALEQPAAPLWRYADAFLDLPLDTSDYMYEDEQVPFLSIALKGVLPMWSGYVNFEANKTEFYLRLAETGVYPSFYVTAEDSSALIYTNSADLYSTGWETWRETVVEYDRELKKLAALTDGAFITGHERMDNGVTKVTYDNGVNVYVNYSETDAEIDGITVGALSWKAGEAQ